jgi:hypothetical protein
MTATPTGFFPPVRDEQTTAQEMALRMAANRRAGRPLFAPLPKG